MKDEELVEELVTEYIDHRKAVVRVISDPEHLFVTEAPDELPKL